MIVKVLNYEYTPELQNKSSPAYKDMERNFTAVVKYRLDKRAVSLYFLISLLTMIVMMMMMMMMMTMMTRTTMMTMMMIMIMMMTMITIFSITVTLLHRLFFGFFVNYLFVHHFVVYLLIQSTVLPFLLSYDLISLNFKTRLKIPSLACLLYAARSECIQP